MAKALLILQFAVLVVILAGCKPASPPVPYGKLDWKDEVFSLDGQPFTGLAEDKHPNGQLRAQYPIEQGKIHGIVREWWDNGQPSTETHFEHGLRHGSNRYWNREGRLLKEQVYDHDKSVSEKVYPSAAETAAGAKPEPSK